MNYKIVRLLFDFRGTSSKKEFRLGIIVLFLLALFSVYNWILSSLFSYIIGLHGAEMMARYRIISPLNIPSLPISFLLFYCSIVLAIKRVKDIRGNSWIGILTGICIFLFFDGILVSLFTSVFQTNYIWNEIDDNTKIFHWALIASVVIFGLIVLVSLLTIKGSKPSEKELKESGVLTISQFITRLGVFCIVLFILSALIGILYTLSIITELIMIKASITSLLLLIWYFMLVYMRLKNSGKPFYPFLLCFVAYIASLSFVLVVHLKSSNLNFINISLFIFSMVSMVFTIANVLLFILKEEHSEHLIIERLSK